MRILNLTPGTGNFHCGSCLRDHGLIKALRRRGHDARLLPLYLPPVFDEPRAGHRTQADAPLFFGGIKTYLQQKSRLARAAPRWMTSLLDHHGLLRWTSRFAGMTQAEDLGELTVSMLKGKDGRQASELDELAKWLARDGKPDLIVLSNALLIGLAPRIRAETGVPVLVTLQGEDSFLDDLPEPYRSEAWQLLQQAASEVDGLIAVSDYYKNTMGRRLALEGSERLHAIHNGTELHDLPEHRSGPPATPTLGYLARFCPPKGTHRLVQAFVKIAPQLPELRLHLLAPAPPADESYVADLRAVIEKAGLSQRVQMSFNISRAEKLALIQDFTVLSVPALYGESFGLYVIEALAQGVPVLQPDHAAFPELIRATGGGELYDPHREEAYEEALLALLRDPERCHELGRAGRAVVHEQFSVDAIATRLETLYESVLGSHKQALVLKEAS